MITRTANLYARIEQDVKIPEERSMNVAEVKEAELNAELERGYANMVAGRTKSARQTFADIRKAYGMRIVSK